MVFIIHYSLSILIAICGFHMAESLFVGRNFVSGISNSKPKNPKNLIRFSFYNQVKSAL